MQNSSQLTQEEYDEPVWYCRHCHSLAVLIDEDLASDTWDGSYCSKCNSTDVAKGKFGDWLKEEERREAKRREIEWSKL